ncbi:MAG: GHKL domain-containing protein [Cyanobacteria bacterium P01_G01_bin.39]
MYTQERYLPEIYKEIPYLISQSVRKEIKNVLPNIIRKELSKLRSNEVHIYDSESSTEINYNSDSELLIRQLSHVLFTPLSAIEASSINIHAFIKASNFSENQQLLSSLDTINSSTKICKSTLIAYRELINILGASNSWNPESLSKMLEESGNVYKKILNRNVGLQIEFPQSIKGYSNNHISALLFPVLENAIEASKENSVVVIKGSQTENMFETTIENSTLSPPPLGRTIYEDGYTTKHNEKTEKKDQGTGLTITQSLLSAYRDASINHDVNGDTVIFKIKLPTRIENEN